MTPPMEGFYSPPNPYRWSPLSPLQGLYVLDRWSPIPAPTPSPTHAPMDTPLPPAPPLGSISPPRPRSIGALRHPYRTGLRLNTRLESSL